MSRLTLRLAPAGLVGILGVLACGDSSGPDTARLSVLLKDAPGNIVAAVVTISEINLQGTGGTTVLSNTSVTTDLLTLAADVTTLVQDAVIPAGTYSQLRFVISGGYIEVDNGNGTTSIFASSPNYSGLPLGAPVSGTLQMPSMGQSGLKVTLPGNALTVSGGEEKIVVVDFDVSQSFGHPAGNLAKWVMHPVIKGADITTTGSAKVTLTLGSGVTLPGTVTLGDFSATLTGSDGVPRTTAFVDPDLDGTFEANFSFIPPDDYDLTIPAPAGVAAFSTTPPLPSTVTVQSGATATAAFTVTAAS